MLLLVVGLATDNGTMLNGTTEERGACDLCLTL